MRADDAAKALGAVVDYVLKRRGVDKLNLVGWSWGTNIAASYTADNPGKVERLALYAPSLAAHHALAGARSRAKWAPIAWSAVIRHWRRWLTGVPEEKKATLIPPGWFDMWADATFATDPQGQGKTLRAPNGVVQDGLDYWGATPPKAFWDPPRSRRRYCWCLESGIATPHPTWRRRFIPCSPRPPGNATSC